MIDNLFDIPVITDMWLARCKGAFAVNTWKSYSGELISYQQLNYATKN